MSPEGNIAVFRGGGGLTRAHTVAGGAASFADVLRVVEHTTTTLPAKVHRDVNFGSHAFLETKNTVTRILFNLNVYFLEISYVF